MRIETSYGIILKKARKAKRLTQEKIAENLNVSLATYQTWEQGLYKADEYALLRLEEVLEDSTLSIRYLKKYSPIWQKHADSLLAAMELQKMHDKLSAIIPHVTAFIDLSAQVMC